MKLLSGSVGLLLASVFALFVPGCATESELDDEAGNAQDEGGVAYAEDELVQEEGDGASDPEVGTSADGLSVGRHKIKTDVDLGGGVIVANRPGGFYMGRLKDGETFDRQQRWYTSRESGTQYGWGRAYGNVDACVWIGPSRGKRGQTAGKWATAGTRGGGVHCNEAQKRWLQEGDARNIGSHFNCPAPSRSAHGTRTKLKAPTSLYFNIGWRGGEMGYGGGRLVDPSARIIPAGTDVWYRYTTRDGNAAVVFIPTVGWGFVSPGLIDRPQGYWNKPSDPPGTRRSCSTRGA